MSISNLRLPTIILAIVKNDLLRLAKCVEQKIPDKSIRG